DVLADNFGLTEADTDVRALYLQDQWRGEQLDILVAARSTDHERFGQQLSWNVDAGWQLADAWSLRGNVGRAFRAPNATFLYGPFGANPDLEPEVSLNREIGLTWRASENHRFTLAGFHNDIDDMIDFDLATFTYLNIAQVTIRGIEIGHEWSAGEWRGNTSLTVQEPENGLTGEPLLRRAEEVLTIGVQRRLGAVDLGTDLLASGDRADIDSVTFLTITEPGYALLNLTANWWVTPAWSLSARLENVLDADYQTASGYNTADRSGFVTLRYTH
ncbi:MAG: TonB-dependent receptor, partial [Proteobacteria bacterium]|nr:TonB-dependent receptor [Pseudomonadota bacterium]